MASKEANKKEAEPQLLLGPVPSFHTIGKFLTLEDMVSISHTNTSLKETVYNHLATRAWSCEWCHSALLQDQQQPTISAGQCVDCSKRACWDCLRSTIGHVCSTCVEQRQEVIDYSCDPCPSRVVNFRCDRYGCQKSFCWEHTDYRLECAFCDEDELCCSDCVIECDCCYRNICTECCDKIGVFSCDCCGKGNVCNACIEADRNKLLFPTCDSCGEISCKDCGCVMCVRCESMTCKKCTKICSCGKERVCCDCAEECRQRKLEMHDLHEELHRLWR